MKILVASVPSDGGDGVSVCAQVKAYCPSATVIVNYFDYMPDAIRYATGSGFNGIARNASDFSTYYDWAATAASLGMWISWGHYSNSFIPVSNPPYLVTNAAGVGTGKNTLKNLGSYGPNLDFFVSGSPNESQACGAIAGRIGQILIDNPTWTFENARYFLRSVSNNFPNFVLTAGYGYVHLNNSNYKYIPYWTPIQPSGLTSVTYNTNITLNWNSQIDASWWNIYSSIISSSSFALSTSSLNNYITITGLSANVNYYYYITAYNSISQQESLSTSYLNNMIFLLDKLMSNSIYIKNINNSTFTYIKNILST